MRINVLNPMATFGLVAALSIVGLACGGDKDGDTSDTADADTDVDVDTDTDTDSDTDLPVTTGFARMVNLLLDPVNGINIHLNADPTPLNEDPFPTGGNTDAAGLDWVPFPPSDYDVDFKNVDDDSLVLGLAAVPLALGEYKTMIALGSDNLSAAFGDPSIAAQGLVILDDTSSPGAGNHRISVYHASVGAPALNVWVGADATATSTPDNIGFAEGAMWTTASGTVTLHIDFTMDEISDLSYDINTDDDAYSYVYLMPDSNQVFPVGQVIHHVNLVDNNPIDPN